MTTQPQDLIAQLEWRYATKEFDSAKTIPADLWDQIENSLVLTPSSFGLQPWHFFAIRDREVREKLQPHSWGQTQVTGCSHFVVLTAKTTLTEGDVDHFLARQVALRGGTLADLADYRALMVGFIQRMDQEALQQWAKAQTYIALGQLMQTAAALGIDACPMEGIVPAEYDQILGLAEKGLTTTVACAMGYRSENDKYATAAKVRFEKSEVVSRL